MSFCPSCNSILQPTEIENKLYLKCRTCGYKEENKNAVISKKVYKFNKTQTIATSNEYLVYDNTLARTTKKQCANEKCPSRSDEKLQDCVFYTDNKSLKLNYVCCVCFSEWTT